MKKYLLISFVIGALAFSLGSCKVEESNYTPDTTGHNMFSAWNQAMYETTENMMEMAFRFNYWLQNDTLPVLYLNGLTYDVNQSSDNVWTLTFNGVSEYVIETDGQTLDSMATWVVTKNKKIRFLDYDYMLSPESTLRYEHASFYSPNTRMEIRGEQPYQWDIQITPGEWNEPEQVYANLKLSLTTPEMPALLKYAEYQLEGSGRFAFVEDTWFGANGENSYTYRYITFQIREPLVSAVERKGHWISGVLNMVASGYNDYINNRTAYLKKNDGNYWVTFYENDDPANGAASYRY